jgi:hypothetical protein
MQFGEALEKCKKGARITRAGWNGKDQFVYYQSGSVVPTENIRNEALLAWARERSLSEIELWGHFDFKPTNNKIQCGWLASQSDMQADDWLVVATPESRDDGDDCYPRLVELDLYLPLAEIGGLPFNAQKVHAVFDRHDDGWWWSSDVLFVSARNKHVHNTTDALSQYLNNDGIRSQIAAAIGASFSDVLVSLPLRTQGGKLYHGVSSSYWLEDGGRPAPGCFYYAAESGTRLVGPANQLHGVAPMVFMRSREKAR